MHNVAIPTSAPELSLLEMPMKSLTLSAVSTGFFGQVT